MPTGALADALGIHASTATRLVDRLDTKHLIRRGAIEGDRRTIVVHLSPAGKRIVEHTTASRREELRVVVARLTPAERGLMEEAMTRFASAAGEIGDESWTLGWSES